MTVLFEKNGKVCTITINRPEVKNAVDQKNAKELTEAFREFEKDETLRVAVLYGSGGTFCAGADLKALSVGNGNEMNLDMSKDGPMGPSRMHLSKPVIAAVSGYAVAGGLELAIWCDLRVMERDAVFGVFCRRFGVPLVDGGTQRLPRLIGMSRALDLILTGRPVKAEEALMIGLANRIVEPGTAKKEAEKLAAEISEFPQACMLSDRQAVYRGFDQEFDKAMQLEFLLGLNVVNSGESREGATRFSNGQGKHGRF
ncbi:crotonase/enoyl-CoA hydratase family protein [Paenibacillus sp. BSR1-1]|uniref:crotonase/enoyl-CoA hydratase family protein n=1 Tax=Paenibacillus sp. BSR1-1 TaxID=3020845 RepID=UPI0025B183DD|nr:crotonase/enoyl-CoA hydratase family protein [Paenibacillus sp. BSR1-1]MDN3016119.1 crotonase/enoyl-CoA hydratase family protein [Paenibacillus sp. BSR1-1]